jgi:hypothetical protein
MRDFFASFVGMIREKHPNMVEVRSAVVSTLKERQQLLAQNRIQSQEDQLYRLKEVI